MKISFDIDGVLADFSQDAIKTIRALYRPDLPADYTHDVWSFANILEPGQWDDAFKFMMQQDNFWTHLRPFKENITPIYEFINTHGEDSVYFVTARPDCRGGSAKTMTQLWLMDNGLPFRNLVVSPSHSAKPDILQAHGIEAHLDDYAPTIQACQGLPGLRAYVLDQKYNQHATELPRVYSTAEYLLEVELGQAPIIPR